MTRLRSLIKEVLSQPKKKDCNCGCNDCGGKAPVLTEGKVKHLISEGLQYHMDKKIQLHESVYRIGSEKHFELIREARALWVRGIIDVSEDDQAILETHLGNFGMYEGEAVPLDMPMVNEGFYSSPSDLEDSGLNVIIKNEIHFNKLKNALKNSDLSAEEREGYFFFPEKEDGYDQLEMEIQDLMDENNIQGYIEGVFEESLNEGPIDRVIGGRPYEYIGDGRKGKAIVSGPMKDREKETIIKRAEKAGYIAKPNMGGGVTIFIESVNEEEKDRFADSDPKAGSTIQGTGFDWEKNEEIEVEKSIKDIEDGDVILYKGKEFKVDYIDPWSAGGRILNITDLKLGKKGKLKVPFLTPKGSTGTASDTMLTVLKESLNEGQDKWVVYDIKTKKRLPNAGKIYKDRKAAQAFADKQENAKVASDTFYFDKIQEKESVDEVDRYSGFNRNPEDPDSVSFEPNRISSSI